MTVAVTLFGVLELYKQGELTWKQDQPFGEIVIQACRAEPRSALGEAAPAEGAAAPAEGAA